MCLGSSVLLVNGAVSWMASAVTDPARLQAVEIGAAFDLTVTGGGGAGGGAGLACRAGKHPRQAVAPRDCLVGPGLLLADSCGCNPMDFSFGADARVACRGWAGLQFRMAFGVPQFRTMALNGRSRRGDCGDGGIGGCRSETDGSANVSALARMRYSFRHAHFLPAHDLSAFDGADASSCRSRHRDR
jgi:hypothetical protein